MDAIDTKFAGAIPSLYEDYLVPLIFQDYALDMAKRIAERGAESVLETAAGTGVVTRALSPLLPREATYFATDLNPAMLSVGRSRISDERVIWHQADALALPFNDASFNAVCCQFGVMFFPDRVKGYREAHRVLKEGGAFVFNVWDRIEDNEFADTVTETLAKRYPQAPPRFLARTPHGYHDEDKLRQELEAVDFRSVTIERLTLISQADTAERPAIAYCQGTPLRTEIEAMGEGELHSATQAVSAAIAKRYGPAPVKGKIQALVVTAIR